MKVISGKYKGLSLLSPKTNNSRPTEAKVKEAVFDMLFPFKENFTALDLFACTGQMGIEFLSRGANSVVFGELNAKNYIALKQNLDKLKECDYKVFKGDFRRTLEYCKDEGLGFDYIFLDPPYKEDYLKISLNLILKYDLLRQDGIIITESDRDLNLSFDENVLLIKVKTYGRKIIKIYKYESDISR